MLVSYINNSILYNYNFHYTLCTSSLQLFCHYRRKIDFFPLILGINNLFFPLHTIIFVNLTIIRYNTNNNNRDQIYCSFFIYLLASSFILSSISFIRFILISSQFITINYIIFIYYIYYLYILSTFYNNKKQINLNYLICCYDYISFISILFD